LQHGETHDAESGNDFIEKMEVSLKKLSTACVDKKEWDQEDQLNVGRRGQSTPVYLCKSIETTKKYNKPINSQVKRKD
jgi:hypothetical protein